MKTVLMVLLGMAAIFYFIEPQISVACMGLAFFVYLSRRPRMSFKTWWIVVEDW